jgi:hypothetical protein
MQPLFDCSRTIIPGSCGFGVVYNHEYNPGGRISQLPGGTGICVSAFVNEPRCKRVYDWIVENCEILYQSPVMFNSNSGNRNFLVVFKRK